MFMRGDAVEFGEFLEKTVGHVGYLIGCRGQLCTPELIARMRVAYPGMAAKIDQCAAKWIGRPVADCLGWCEMFEAGSNGDPISEYQYLNRRTYEDYALAQSAGLPHGPIATIPRDLPYPIAVGYPGHVGYYWKGIVYQSAGHCTGTVISHLGEVLPGLAPWSYWYQLPYLSIPKKEDLMKQGDNNPRVGSWQLALDAIGLWPAGVAHNNNFGPTTLAITNGFKASVHLPQDGVVDESTWAKMADTLREAVQTLTKLQAGLTSELQIAKAHITAAKAALG